MRNVLLKLGLLIVLASAVLSVDAQQYDGDKFRQLSDDLWATPNVYRTGSGAPGHKYWQQKADYDMQITIDDTKQQLHGEQTVTYTNNSPDPLGYLWVQLDQNAKTKESLGMQARTQKISKYTGLSAFTYLDGYDGGFKLEYVQDANGNDLPHVINNTMMRINLPTPLLTGETFTYKIKWWYNINDRAEVRGRSGMEYFPDEDNYLYVIAQFYPRLALYSDYEGWHNKQFIGSGEFTLTFGDYKVSITTPSDFVVGATGVLSNADEVLTETQKKRFAEAKKSDKPVMIVTEAEARKAEKSKAKDTKTWTFEAENVRDFAFAGSRKFIWDAQAVKFGDRTVMAMSYFPKEGNPLWEKYSTKVVAHTLRVYSKYTIDYPYPVAISVHTNRIGMEYPMICFNGGRPEADGTYSKGTKYGMIGVIIHEVGHNFFPMIVNSDERQWSWMDEGLNTFCQYLTEQEWEPGYPSRNGTAYKITDYMKGDKTNISPIMTNSESVRQFHYNAYTKPSVALNVLRETVMGRELFDFALKTYSERWAFKHPTPEDFFRTMEDASAVDLDWFWRGWFYTTDHVDIALSSVKLYQLNTQNPSVEKPLVRAGEQVEFISDIRNEKMVRFSDNDKSVLDFYNSYDPHKVTELDKKAYKKFLAGLSSTERKFYDQGYSFTEVKFKNIGGLVMPLIVKLNFTDGTSEVKRIPAEIWRKNTGEVSKVFVSKKKTVSVELDPYLETADTERTNNHWPAKMEESRFELYKRNSRKSSNPMQKK